MDIYKVKDFFKSLKDEFPLVDQFIDDLIELKSPTYQSYIDAHGGKFKTELNKILQKIKENNYNEEQISMLQHLCCVKDLCWIDVYYYTEQNIFEKIIEKGGSIWATDPIKANDPFEFLPLRPSNIQQSKAEQWLENQHKIIVGYKINPVCFSSTPYSNAMWGHYGGDHTGVCLHFKLPIIYIDSPETPSPYKDTQNFLIFTQHKLLAVKYEQDRVDISHNGVDLSTWMYKAYRLFSTKGEEWSFEKEFRLMILADKNSNETRPKVTEILPYLQGVIIGLKNKNIRNILTIRKKIENQLIHKNIALYKSVMKSDTFAFEFLRKEKSGLTKVILKNKSFDEWIKEWDKKDDK